MPTVDPQPDPLDAMLRQHLSSTLDPQLGRAEAAFRQRIVGPSAFPRLASGEPSHRSHRWLYAAGAALAASIAVLALLPPLRPDRPPGPTPGPNGRTPVVATPVESPMLHYTQNRAWDEGTVTIGQDGHPVRRVRLQRIDRAEWTDDEGVRMRLIIPQEGIRYVEMDTY